MKEADPELYIDQRRWHHQDSFIVLNFRLRGRASGAPGFKTQNGPGSYQNATKGKGDNMYYFTWALQYANLFMSNIGFIILAGEALKAICTLHANEGMSKLPYCITITGIVCSIFAFCIPHLSALRLWLGVSTLLSLIYIIITIVLSINDGLNNRSRDYEIPGSKATKIFNSIGAGATMVYVYNSGMLPEIQATIKRPYVRDMHKALYLEFLIGNVPIYVVTFVGYWAYGSSTSSYLLDSVNGPKWVKTLANTSTFLQTVISIHICASPIYEYLDTKFGRMNESIYYMHNWIVRLATRGAYLFVTTLVAAMFPFLGDFMTLTSAVSVIPLTFVFPNHMYIQVNGNDLKGLPKAWHWVNIWFFFVLAIVGTVTSLRSIIIDYKTYHLFADLSS